MFAKAFVNEAKLAKRVLASNRKTRLIFGPQLQLVETKSGYKGNTCTTVTDSLDIRFSDYLLIKFLKYILDGVQLHFPGLG